MSHLFEEALQLFPILGTHMTHQHWTWDLLNNKIQPNQANCHYWQLRTDFEGLVLFNSVNLTEFDTIPICWTDFQDSMDFLSNVLKFQIHEALCRLSGYDLRKPIHLCDFTNGTPQELSPLKLKIGEYMSLGSSKHWTEILHFLTGQRHVDASAMLSYFKPLIHWLNNEKYKF